MTNPSAIRALYVFHRRALEERLTGQPSSIGAGPVPSWDGGTDRNGRTFKSVWPNVASFLDQRSYEPHEYLEAVFDDAVLRGTPLPNQLASAAMENVYRDYSREAQGRARIKLSSQQVCFLIEVQKARRITGGDDNSAASQVLCDPGVDLISLFRYCMAENCGAHEVARLYRAQALQYLALHFFAYSSGWEDFIPGPMLDAAAEIVAMLSQGGVEE